jgi:hypothetical protein
MWRRAASQKNHGASKIMAPEKSWRQQNHGGAYRDRTDDPLLAKQVLSQLS